jgi:hypothetical protein
MTCADYETNYLEKIMLKCPIQKSRLEALAQDDCFEPCVLNVIEEILNEEKSLPLNILMTFLSMLRRAETSDRMLCMVAIQNGTYGTVNIDFATQLLSFGVTPLNSKTLLSNVFLLKPSIYMVFVIARLWVVCPDRKEDLIRVLGHFYPDKAELSKLFSPTGLKCGDRQVKKAVKILMKYVCTQT